MNGRKLNSWANFLRLLDAKLLAGDCSFRHGGCRFA